MAALQTTSVSQGVEFDSRMIRRSLSPIMSTRTKRADGLQRPGLPRGLDVVAAAVGVVVALPLADRFLAVEEEQLDVIGRVRGFSARASSISNAALDPPSLAPTNVNSLNSLVS